MAPKTKESPDFVTLITMDDWKTLISACVTSLTHERTMLEKARLHPKRVDKPTRVALGVEKRTDLTNVDLAEARVKFFERAQDTLWEWYGILNEQATEPGS